MLAGQSRRALLAVAMAGVVVAVTAVPRLVPQVGQRPVRPSDPALSGLSAVVAAPSLEATVLPVEPQAAALPVGPQVASDAETSSVAVPWPRIQPGPTAPSGFFLRVPILMYHRIVPSALAGDSLPSLVVPPALFAAQLAALRAAGWRSVTVATVAAALAAHRPLPPRTFAISIDDGWADGFTYALPILLRYGDVATFYVIAGRLADPDFLSTADLRILAGHGMEIGDHTLDHVDLTRQSPAALQLQVMTAAADIAAAAGERPVTLAYPFGRFDPAVEAALQRDGFALAVTTQPGWYEDQADRFAVPRVRVGPSLGPSALVAELSGSLRLG